MPGLLDRPPLQVPATEFDAALARAKLRVSDGSRLSIRSGATLGARCYWTQVGQRTGPEVVMPIRVRPADRGVCLPGRKSLCAERQPVSVGLPTATACSCFLGSQRDRLH